MKTKKNFWLEVLRGIAAFEVVFNHLFNFSYFKILKSTRLNFITNWATEAVIIFFILSGIVINYSQVNNPKSRNTFIKNRLIRIVPIFFVAVSASIILGYCLLGYRYTFYTYLGNIFFLSTLSGFIVQTIHENPPIWSLTFEMFFYMLYAFSITSFHSKFIRVWFIASLISMPFYLYGMYSGVFQHCLLMLSFSSIWLCGYFIYKYHDRLLADKRIALLFISLLPLYSRIQFSPEFYDPFKYFVFSIITIPVFVYLLKINKAPIYVRKAFYVGNLSFLVFYILGILLILFISKSLFSNKLIYIIIPSFAFAVSFFRVKRMPLLHLLVSRMASFFYFIGTVSYTLYVIHMPIIYLVDHFTPAAKFYIGIPIAIAITCIGVYCIDWKFQPLISNYLKNIGSIKTPQLAVENLQPNLPA